MNKRNVDYWKNDDGSHFSNHADKHLTNIYPYLLLDLTNHIKKGIEGFSILEIGCGPGHMLPIFLEGGASRLCALDASYSMLSKAKSSSLNCDTILLQGQAEYLPFADASFDLVFSRGSIFFWESLDLSFQGIKRVLKANGIAFIGGGYGLSTPDEIVAAVTARKTGKKNSSIPRLDLDDLLITAENNGLKASLLQKKGRGFWLALVKGSGS